MHARLGTGADAQAPVGVASRWAIFVAPLLAGVFAFYVFGWSGVPTAIFGGVLIALATRLAVKNWNRPPTLAAIAAAYVAVAGILDLLFGESAPETTVAILAGIGLLIIASAISPIVARHA